VRDVFRRRSESQIRATLTRDERVPPFNIFVPKWHADKLITILEQATPSLKSSQLGTIPALELVASNCQHLRDIIMDRPTPLLLSGVFIDGLSIYSRVRRSAHGFLLILREGDLK
jgi:hypothetical protein